MVTTTSSHHRSDTKRAAAAGLTIFAAVMLFISGSMTFCRGLMAVLEDEVFLTTADYAFQFDLTTWGWIHMGLGTIAVVISAGLLAAMKWARVIGVAIAALMIIANFLSVPYHPFWSLTLIALSGFIIWGLCVVDRETLG
ncbi:Integral membrane protein OS=Streptomyces alboniger OX=132473 GN=CP975_18285 PE=4 SV=1 [Streptomyces alboniger]